MTNLSVCERSCSGCPVSMFKPEAMAVVDKVLPIAMKRRALSEDEVSAEMHMRAYLELAAITEGTHPKLADAAALTVQAAMRKVTGEC